MFQPVGSQPPSVYWRRRLLFVGSIVLIIVLLIVTIQALTSRGGGQPVGAATGVSTPSSTVGTPRSSPSKTVAHRRSSAAKSSSSSSGRSSSNSPSGSSSRPSSSAAPVACKSANLAVAAVAGQSTYRVGEKPMVELQVTNKGPGPCVQDLADRQVVLKVYNGESRVWGSHDCEIQPGTDKRTLIVGRAVRVSVTWSGFTSQPSCAGTRQRVGAGTYTLYAALSGKTGTATQFSIV